MIGLPRVNQTGWLFSHLRIENKRSPMPVVSDMPGYSDMTTTLRIYTYITPGAQREAAKALESILTG